MMQAGMFWFEECLCICVQVGVPRPDTPNDQGWAVADVNKQPDAIAAGRLAHFVATTLKQQVSSV